MFTSGLIESVEIKESYSHGFGVFATADIPRYTVWWQGEPNRNVLLINPKQYRDLIHSTQSPMTQGLAEAVEMFAFYVSHYDSLALILDNGRYVNHSFTPNSMVCPDSDGLCSVTMRDIKAGEEIVENYTHFDQCPWAQLWGNFGQYLSSLINTPQMAGVLV